MLLYMDPRLPFRGWDKLLLRKIAEFYEIYTNPKIKRGAVMWSTNLWNHDFNAGYEAYDSAYGAVIGECSNGLFLELDNGETAFSYFGGLRKGTRVLGTIRRKAEDALRRLVSIDSVLDVLEAVSIAVVVLWSSLSSVLRQPLAQDQLESQIVV